MKLFKIKGSIVFAVAYCLLIASFGLLTACPKKDAVRSAIDASYRLPATTNDVIRQVTTARDRGIITLEQSQKFGEYLSQMARAETVYIGMVKAMQAAIKATGSVDAAQLKSLKDFFDVSIVAPFLNVLEYTRLLSGDSVQLILLAVTAARLLIRTIGSGIGSGKINSLSADNVVRGVTRSAFLKSNNWRFA